MKVNYEKIAESAGVSPATVSRVVNNRPGVSKQRAELVRRVMRELDFDPMPMDQRPVRNQPDAVSKANTKGRAGRIGVLVLDTMHQFAPNLFATQVRGLQVAAAEHGLGVMLEYLSPTRPIGGPAFRDQDIDGLIVIGSASVSGLDRVLGRRPRVWLNSHHEAAGDAVLAGNQQVGALAADYLLNRGHRRLGFVCAMADLPPYPTRLEAFQNHVKLSGSDTSVETLVAKQDGRTVTGTGDLESMQAQIAKLADQGFNDPSRPTGLFVPNDMMTAMLYAELSRRSIRVGRDVEIISCNNELTCLVGISPRPATIDIGGEAIGARAVEQLVWRINHPDDKRQAHLAIEPLLIEGQVEADRWCGAEPVDTPQAK